MVGSFTTNQAGTTTINLTSPNVADGVLTLKRNGVPVGTFTANQAMPANIDIVVPTTVAEMTDATQYAKTTDIPTQTSQLTNNSGFITASDVPAQVNADWNATSGAAQILNKPTIPAAQVNADWNATSGAAQILNKPTIPAAQVNADWNATSGAAEILNKPAISEIQILSVSHDTMYFTNGTYAVMSADWTNVTNKPAIPQNTSDLTNNSGFITAADVPAHVQADWNEGNDTDPAFIRNKPDLSNYATHAEIAAADYLTDADMSNFVTKTEDETIGGDKTFTDYTYFDGGAEFNSAAHFNEYDIFNAWVQFNGAANFYDEIYVDWLSGRLKTPSVLQSISNDGTFTILDNKGGNDCKNAVNFCDLQAVYNDLADKLQSKFDDLNDQVQDLLDSIDKLNKEKNIPKDGEVCPNTPSVIDVDGNIYSTVRIGNQCWMRENLRVTKRPDGTNLTKSSSSSTAAGYYKDPYGGSSSVFVQGYEYNFYAASNGLSAAASGEIQGICPVGWRLPTNADWTELNTYMQTQVQHLPDGSIKKALSSPSYWPSSTNVGSAGNNPSINNAFGFSMVPAHSSGWADLWASDLREWGWSNSGTGALSSWSGNASSFYGVRCIRAYSNGEPNTVQLPTVFTNAPSAANIYDVNVAGTDVSLKIKPGVITENDNSLPPMTNLTEYGFVFSSTANTSSSLVKDGSGVTPMTTTVSTQPASYPVNVGQSVSTDYFEVSGLISGTTYYYRVYATNGAGTAYGDVMHFVAQSDPKSCRTLLGSSYPDHATDVEGNNYPTVAIGSQCWMAQNLRTSQYADGSTISGTVIPGDGTLNADYGRLYNFAQTLRGTASTDLPVQGVCPNGWHVPTSDEWDALWNYLKGISAYQCGGNSLYISKAMASQSGWTAVSLTCSPGNDQTTNNASGFNAYPAGYCSSSNQYSYGTFAGFMSTTYGVNCNVIAGSAALNKTSSTSYDYGRSVRCVYNEASSSVAPTVGTGSATCTDITAVNNNRSVAFKYTITGTVYSGSGIAERGICYSNTVTTPTYESGSTITSTSNNISVTLNNLEPGTTYYFRAYAKTSNGNITYGAVSTIVLPTLPTVTTVGVNSYTATTASLSGIVNSLGTTSKVTLKSRGVDVRTAQYPSGTTLTYATMSGSSTGTYNVSVSGLTAGTTYYAIANYNVTITLDGLSKNFNLYSNGSGVPFMVGTKPSVSATSVTYMGDDQSQMKYTWDGNLLDAGNPTITEKGFVCSKTNSTPTLRTGENQAKFTLPGTSTGMFAYSPVVFTAPNTTWYVRTYAVSALDTVYGTVSSFKTHDYPGVNFANNYASDYYYSAEVTLNKIRLNSSFVAKSSSSTSGGCDAAFSQGYVYSTSPMTIPDADATSSGINSSSQPSTFGTSVTTDGGIDTLKNLSSNTKYYIRAWVRSAAGYTYSNERVIRTKLSCGGILHDQSGNTYNTVTIGSGSSAQCWMKSNLKTIYYDNTLNQTENSSGTALTYGGSSHNIYPRYYYPGGESSNVTTHGYLYNWYAAAGSGVSYGTYSTSMMKNSLNNVQGICPRGWHLPTQAEWIYLDGVFNSYNTAFAPKCAGYFADGTNFDFNHIGDYWSSTLKSGDDDYYQWRYNCYNNTHSVLHDDAIDGLSVRCIQDN